MRSVASADPEPEAHPRHAPVDVEIVVPVYNEAANLTARVTELRQFLDHAFPFRALVTVVDNASTDETYSVATALAASMDGVAAMHLARKGRGHALRQAWSTSTAPVVAYMDVDLSTRLPALLPLVAPLLSGHSDLSVGTRLAPGAQVVRGPKRELISRGYNLILKVCLNGHFSDAQCGFKALRREAALALLPLVQDEEWFFDTELLVAAERLGLRIYEVPVVWVDDPDSRVDIVRTALSDLHGVWRISRHQARLAARRASSSLGRAQLDQVSAEELLRFAGVGVLSTLAYACLFLALSPLVGLFASNTLALAVCTLANTAVHRRLARGAATPSTRRFVALTSGLLALSLALTTLALVLAVALAGTSLIVAVLAVGTGSALSAVVRFVALRKWIFRVSPGAPDQPPEVLR